MLVFAIACVTTASLGLVALNVPSVAPALERFGRWAGLFMQVAGLIEALRRLIRNPLGVFNITPAAPAVSFASGPSITVGSSKRTQHRMTERLDNLQERAGVLEAVSQEELHAAVEELMDIERIVNGYSPEVFLRSPDLDLKIKSELTKFIHHAPSGAFDDIANARDPLARKATALYWKIDDLAEQAVALINPEPVDPDELMDRIIASEEINN